MNLMPATSNNGKSRSNPRKYHTHLYLLDDDIMLPEPESKRTIMLPSEKPESEPVSVVDLDLTDSDRIVLDAEPTTVIGTVEEEEKKGRFPIGSAACVGTGH
uniref:Uncharacterized protein n=1 Tax=Kalanchoe fedtschenkoi TaxID=63787 RepID=A0A7N0T118_KALFE